MQRLMARGQSMFEVVLAMGVVGVILVAVVGLANVSLKNSNFVKSKDQATKYLDEGMEFLRTQRDLGWVQFRANALRGPDIWCLDDLSTFSNPASWPAVKNTYCNYGGGSSWHFIPGTFFKREVYFGNQGVNSLGVTMYVYWGGGNAQGDPYEQKYYEISTSTVFTNWR